MVFMLSIVEKKIAEESIPRLLRSDEGKLFQKIITNYIGTHDPVMATLFPDDDKMLANDANVADLSDKLAQYLICYSEDLGVTYSTGDLAKYFGVSIVTINNWINEGRFLDFVKEPTRHARIPASCRWRATNGKIYTVQDFITHAKEEARKRAEIIPEEHRQLVANELQWFTNRYGENGLAVLEAKGDQKNEEEKRDAYEWRYWLSRSNNA